MLVGAQGDLETTPAFGDVPPTHPEVRQCSCHPQFKLYLARGLEVVECATEVVVLALQPIEPRPAALQRFVIDMRLPLPGAGQETRRVAVTPFACLVRRLEPLGPVLADRLQHPEPDRKSTRLNSSHG